MDRNEECERAVETRLSPGATEHGGDRRRTPNLDGSQNLEAMPPVERDVLGVRGFQVGGRAVLVTTPESILQQKQAAVKLVEAGRLARG